MFSWLFLFRLWLLPSLYLVCCCFFAFLFFCETSVCCFLIVAVVNKRQGFPCLQCCLVPFCGSFNLHGNVGMCALQKVTVNVTVLRDGSLYSTAGASTESEPCKRTWPTHTMRNGPSAFCLMKPNIMHTGNHGKWLPSAPNLSKNSAKCGRNN